MKIEEFHKCINHAMQINKDTYAEIEEKEPLVSIEMIREIIKIYNTIYALDKRGITSDNYHTKVKNYKKFINKAFIEYGIEINEPYPFSNPAELHIEIDSILIEAGLTAEQRNIFFRESELRDRIPKGKKRKSLLSDIIELDNDDWISNDIYEEWDKFSIEEQDLLQGITPEDRHEEFENQQYTEEEHIKRQQIKQALKLLKYTPPSS